eukprot:m.210798 g.210798  ORF g.210798 m.210798 type:complete len:1151 (-) comp15053_c0_seq1:31-3483(-)
MVRPFSELDVGADCDDAFVTARALRRQHQRAVLTFLGAAATLRAPQAAMYGSRLRHLVTFVAPLTQAFEASGVTVVDPIASLSALVATHSQKGLGQGAQLRFAVPRVLAQGPQVLATSVAANDALYRALATGQLETHTLASAYTPTLYKTVCAAAAPDSTLLRFPSQDLIQHRCSKLQTLQPLLREKQAGGHRVLIFTQMTRMLDILEQFLSGEGYRFLRLDGSTPVVERQRMMDRFNRDDGIFCFILSTRSGGLGMNLTGADTVVFYDSDWNPTMDAQAQDRCHRIGQTRDVHIYRLICASTVEENILLKANQKRRLGELAIEGGTFTPEFLKGGISDLFDGAGATSETESGTGTTSNISSTPSGSARTRRRNKSTSTSKVKGTEALLGDPTEGLDEQEIEQGFLAAEDEDDREAAIRARRETVTETDEFVDIGDGSGTDEEEVDPVEALNAQLEGLRGVEKHALEVLQRYLTPSHQAQLQRAREEMREKDLQLREMQAKLQACEDELTSDEEEMLFYDKTELEEAFMHYVSHASDLDEEPYAAPQPRDQLDVHIDTSLVTQYRLGFMLFEAPPNLEHRRRKRRKRIKDLYKRPLRHMHKDWPLLLDLGDYSTSRKRAHAENATPTAPRGLAASIFRKKEEKALRQHAKLPKHPRKPQKLPSLKEKRDVDTNRDAPAWLIEEDWILVQTVRNFLSQSGSINWFLVADVVNTSTSYTGRTRTRFQCRDRYFNVIMNREDGKAPPPKDEGKKTKKKKAKKEAAVPEKVLSTQTMYQKDERKSLNQYHASLFQSIMKAAGARKDTTKAAKQDIKPQVAQQQQQLLESRAVAAGCKTPQELAMASKKAYQDLLNERKLEQERLYKQRLAKQQAMRTTAPVVPAYAPQAGVRPLYQASRQSTAPVRGTSTPTASTYRTTTTGQPMATARGGRTTSTPYRRTSGSTATYATAPADRKSTSGYPATYGTGASRQYTTSGARGSTYSYNTTSTYGQGTYGALHGGKGASPYATTSTTYRPGTPTAAAARSTVVSVYNQAMSQLTDDQSKRYIQTIYQDTTKTDDVKSMEIRAYLSSAAKPSTTYSRGQSTSSTPYQYSTSTTATAYHGPYPRSGTTSALSAPMSSSTAQPRTATGTPYSAYSQPHYKGTTQQSKSKK